MAGIADWRRVARPERAWGCGNWRFTTPFQGVPRAVSTNTLFHPRRAYLTSGGTHAKLAVTLPRPQWNSKHRAMSRNLVICCDGTNNQFGPENTNVVRLVQVLSRDPARQHVYYDPGDRDLARAGGLDEAAKWLSKLGGLAFGAGILWKVGEAYTFLMDNWEPGDQVFLFGFSRGA